MQAWVANFERPRITAQSLFASPAGLSPYLRFGCLSCRVFYYNLRELYIKVSNCYFMAFLIVSHLEKCKFSSLILSGG